MSLTSFLKVKAVKERFREEFEKLKLLVKREMNTLPLTKNYMRVGTAFDYLLRFKLEHLNKETLKSQEWVAEYAPRVVPPDRILLTGEAFDFHGENQREIMDLAEKQRKDFAKKTQKIVSDAKENLSAFLNTGKMSDKLIKSSLLLATLDPLHRSRSGFEHVGVVDSKDIEDLGNLISLVDKKTFKAKSTCLLNPNFG